MPIHAMPAIAAPPTPSPSHANGPTRRAAVVIALLFLGATATFLAGDVLVVGALEGPVIDTDALRLGIALQAVNAFAVAGLGVAFLRVLPDSARRLAGGHLALRIVEAVVIIGIGGSMLATETLVDYEPVIYVFTGTAGLLLTAALARTTLVERWLVRLGAVGYVAILAALPLQLLTPIALDTFPGLLLYVPGGMFELVLPVLLLARGLRRQDPDQPDDRERRRTLGDPATSTLSPAGSRVGAKGPPFHGLLTSRCQTRGHRTRLWTPSIASLGTAGTVWPIEWAP